MQKTTVRAADDADFAESLERIGEKEILSTITLSTRPLMMLSGLTYLKVSVKRRSPFLVIYTPS